MEERRCPKCENPIAAENKFCPNCGAEISPEERPQSDNADETPLREVSPIPLPAKKKSSGGLWLAAVLIIIGLIVAGTMIAYMVVSSLGTEKWRAIFGGSPIPEPATAASNAVTASENAAQQDKPKATSSPLIELPSTAPANDYIVLKQGVTVQHHDDTNSFNCTLENVSGVVCTGAGVEVELYDAALNFIGSSSSWVYRDIQPGEVLELSFESENVQKAFAFCLTRVGGKPIETQPSADSKASDGPSATPEQSSSPDAPFERAFDKAEAASALSGGDVALSDGLTLLDGIVNKEPVAGICRLEGRIRNDSGIKYSSVYVRFAIYDAEDNRITTAIASIDNLEADVVWKFSTMVMASYEQAASYKIGDISVYQNGRLVIT